MRTLPSHRQAAAVAQTTVATDIHQPFDVHGNFGAQGALHPVIFGNDIADFGDIIIAQILDARIRINAGLLENSARVGHPDSENVGQPYLDALFFG